MLAANEFFAKLNKSGTNLRLSKEQQVAFLEGWIIEGKIHDFNESEKERIIDEARMMALYGEEMGL